MQQIIGFANLDDQNPFATAVQASLEDFVAAHPQLRLLVRSNNLNSERALANTHEFADLPVNLAILFHIDERIGPNLTLPLRQKRIPVVSLAIPIAFTTFMGVDEQGAGILVGDAVSQWAQAHWRGQVDRILVLTDSRLLQVNEQRLDYAIATIQEHLETDMNRVLHLDSGQERGLIFERALPVLERWRAEHVQRIALICLNDHVALSAVDVVREAGMEDRVIIASYDGTDAIRAEMCRPGSRVIASVDFDPQQFAVRVGQLCLDILAGQPVPRQNVSEARILTPEVL
jgi:ABC-type sugar transport system substrate-binding protein